MANERNAYVFVYSASLTLQWQQSEKNMGKKKREQTSCLFIIQQQCDVSAERRTNSLIPMSKHLALGCWSARTKSAALKHIYSDLSCTKWVKFHLIWRIGLSRSLSAFQRTLSGFFLLAFQSFYLFFDINSKQCSLQKWPIKIYRKFSIFFAFAFFSSAR